MMQTNETHWDSMWRNVKPSNKHHALHGTWNYKHTTCSHPRPRPEYSKIIHSGASHFFFFLMLPLAKQVQSRKEERKGADSGRDRQRREKRELEN